MEVGDGSTERPLTARVIERAVVYPTIRVASHPGQLLMGVYDEQHRYVEGTVLDRRSGERGAPVPPDLFPQVDDATDPAAIYLGPLYFHYGHFLLESLARLWYAARHPELPIVWAGSHTWQGYELRPFQREILDLLGLTNATRIIADPTRYETLHVPEVGYRYDDWFHPEHAAFLARYAGPAQVPGHRMWLSRRKVDNDARDLHSAPTEARLAHAGWTIAHPESLTVRQQLDLFGRAEVVAGEEGSAFHTLMLLRSVAGKKLQILRRFGPEHGNLRTIGEARGVDQTFHTPQQERVLKADGRVVSKLNPNSAEILDILGVPVPPAPVRVPSRTEEVLDEIVARYAPQRLLVVGASDPHLVLASTAATRVAVSPRFDVDIRSCADSGVQFYELGLEQYADVFHEDREPFDLIRLTGPDLPAVMGSFRVSQRLAGPGTIWLLGCGDLAARAGLAIRTLHPGFAVRRVFIDRRIAYVAWRLPDEPAGVGAIARLSGSELRTRLRLVPPVRLPRPEGKPARRSIRVLLARALPLP